MFSTILKEITSYFDRRALLSAFFPSVVAWATTFALWNLLRHGSIGISNEGVLANGLLLVTFLVWCAFWSFLTLNFRAGLTRLFEGHWPFAAWLEGNRRTVQKSEYSKRHADDYELEQKWIAIDDLSQSLMAILEGTQEYIPTSLQGKGNELDELLGAINEQLKDWDRTTISQLDEDRELADGLWSELASPPASSPLGDVTSPPGDNWEERRNTLDATIRRLEQVNEEVSDERARRVRNFEMYYPPDLHQVMPTRLGNVLRSVDVLVGKRYHLDAALIWSRLQPELPREFSESLNDTRMGLDMMLTLSGFCLIFGLAQSLLLAYGAPLELLGTAPLILAALIPIAARRLYKLQRRGTVMVAVVTVLVLIVIPFIAIAWWLRRGFPGPLVTIGDAGLRIETFLVLMTGYCFLAWLVYSNAVHAAVAYGEKVQSAFDLYRWKVFDALHLQQPPGFADEQRMWEEVCDLLARSKPPNDRYYRYLKDEKTKEEFGARPATVSSAVPVRVLPPYKEISADDLEVRDLLLSDETEDVVATPEEIARKAPLSKLPVGKPIPRTSLVDLRNLENTIAVGLPAELTASMSRALQPGDVVEMLIVFAHDENASPPARSIALPNVVLLTTGDAVTVAVPSEYRFALEHFTEASALVLSKQL